ncbi:MAG: hypothetical protein EOM10_09290, partial [Opitutae bacterium]|nr:hypothetical protein [Opitutae bacterium]
MVSLAVVLWGAMPTISAGVVRYRETWDAAPAGWEDRDAAEMTVSHSAAVGFPAGSLQGTFAAQGGVPMPETDAFRATADASGGAFTGNYFEHYDEFYGWSFDFRAADVFPSTLQVRFSGAGSV